VSVRDPDTNEIQHLQTVIDETKNEWRSIFQKPGKYLVGISCEGDGGGGPYSLSRNVLHARTFSIGKPAQAAIHDGEVQIWQFTAQPGNPLYIHWKSAGWKYEVNIYDEKGQWANFERQFVDDQNAFGILSVKQPQTYVIVLTGHGEASDYLIELSPLPGLPTKPPAKESKKS
jgi:hypothetical protein